MNVVTIYLKREFCRLFRYRPSGYQEFLTIMILEVLFKTCFMEYASRIGDENHGYEEGTYDPETVKQYKIWSKY